MSGAISLAVHVIWSCDTSSTLPINSAPSIFKSQGKGIIHHSSICIYVQTSLDVRYLNCTCRNKNKRFLPSPSSNPPCPRNMGPSNWRGGLFRLNGQPHLLTSTTPKPTDDLFPLPAHKSFPLLTFNRRQSSTFFSYPYLLSSTEVSAHCFPSYNNPSHKFRKVFSSLQLTRSSQRTSDALQSHLLAVSSQAGTPKQSSKDSQDLRPLQPL